jgi:hypothetical protein
MLFYESVLTHGLTHTDSWWSGHRNILNQHDESVYFYKSVHKSAPHDGSYFSLTHRFTNSRNCKFKAVDSGQFCPVFFLYESVRIYHHHADWLMQTDSWTDSWCSGHRNIAGLYDESVCCFMSQYWLMDWHIKNTLTYGVPDTDKYGINDKCYCTCPRRL